MRLEALVGLRAATVNQVADVNRFRPAHDDIVAARAQGVAGPDHDLAAAAVVADGADHLEPAGHAGAEQVTVVQLVLLDHVALEAIEIVLGQQLSGKEARPAQALEPAADRTDGPRVAHRLLAAIRHILERHSGRGMCVDENHVDPRAPEVMG